MTLENISFDVNMQGTLTSDAVPIEANGTVVVKIKNEESMIRSAVEQFNCGREETKQHIMETARDVCEGRLREIIADMTAEQLYKRPQDVFRACQRGGGGSALRIGPGIEILYNQRDWRPEWLF